jgi:threonine efflux protein
MLQILITIAILHWAVLLMPGFNFVLIGQLAAGGSRRAAFAAVIGMTTATLIWASLAVAGVGAVFTAHPSLRLVAQALGGLYLLHLAIQLLRSSGKTPSAGGGVMRPAAALRAGFTTSALNPKIALFYGSVFATSLPAQPSAWQVLAAVALVYANSWVWHGSLALALSHPRVQAAYVRHYQRLNKVSSLLVGAFGVRLLITAFREARSRSV